jgi:hypothetical protein
MDALNDVLLQLKPGFKPGLIGQYSQSNSRENFLRTATIQIMSTPEYQVC